MLAAGLLAVAFGAPLSDEAPSPGAATMPARGSAIDVVWLRTRGVPTSDLVSALRLRMPQLRVDTAQQQPPAEHLVYIEVQPHPAGTFTVVAVAYDGRGYTRTVDPGSDPPARVLATTLATLLSAIEDNTIEPDRTDAAIPKPKTATPPEPVDPQTSDPPLTPLPRWEMGVGVVPVAVLGLAPSGIGDRSPELVVNSSSMRSTDAGCGSAVPCAASVDAVLGSGSCVREGLGWSATRFGRATPSLPAQLWRVSSTGRFSIAARCRWSRKTARLRRYSSAWRLGFPRGSASPSATRRSGSGQGWKWGATWCPTAGFGPPASSCVTTPVRPETRFEWAASNWGPASI